MPRSAQSTRFTWVDLPGYCRPFGGQLVLDRLREQGMDVSTDGIDRDRTLLVSLYWVEMIYDWIRFRQRNGIDSRWTTVAGGNYATGSPAAVAPFCTAVFRGDADYWDGGDAMLNAPTPVVATPIPQRCIVMEAKRVGKQSFPIIELSRGCRFRCRYCQYTWMKPYREQEAGWIVAQLEGATRGGERRSRFRLASVDVPSHSDYGRIHEVVARCGVRIVNQDAALLTLRRHAGPLPRMLRFGVDGMSERLRLAVGKPIKRDWLIDKVVELSHSGVRRCLSYNIFGLPGETSSDFDEWEDTVREIVARVQRPFTLVNSWNAFLPMPLTPLAGAPSSHSADHRNHQRMSRLRDDAGRAGVQVFDMPEYTNGRTITERMLAVRATPRTAHVVMSVALQGQRISERAILQEFERCEGFDLHGVVADEEAVHGTE